MSLINSVNTNMGAMIALESLNSTNSQLAAVQKQVSTGYRVADATDDGAAYAVAQSVRSTVGALTTANQQLGNVQGLLSTTQSGLNNISNTMASMRDVLVEMANSGGATFTQYQAQYKSLLANVKTFVQDANYNGKTLIGNISGGTGPAAASLTVVRNDTGGTYGIVSMGMSAVYTSMASLTNASGATLTNAITSGGLSLSMAALYPTAAPGYVRGPCERDGNWRLDKPEGERCVAQRLDRRSPREVRQLRRAATVPQLALAMEIRTTVRDILLGRDEERAR